MSFPFDSLNVFSAITFMWTDREAGFFCLILPISSARHMGKLCQHESACVQSFYLHSGEGLSSNDAPSWIEPTQLNMDPRAICITISPAINRHGQITAEIQGPFCDAFFQRDPAEDVAISAAALNLLRC